MMNLRTCLALALLPLTAACAPIRTSTPATPPTAASANQVRLTALFDAWHGTRWPESPAADSQLAALPTLRRFQADLLTIPLRKVPKDDSLSALVLAHYLDDRIAYLEGRYFVLPLTGWFDYHQTFATPAVTDTAAFTRQLRRFPDINQAHIANMREGIRRGLVRPKQSFANYISTIQAHIHEDPVQSPWGKALCGRIAPGGAACVIPDHPLQAISAVTKAYIDLRDFLVDEYVPAGTETLGIRSTPEGEAYYRYLVRYHTTMDITPDSVHAIGLREVARIRAEMDVAKEATGFEGGFPEFLAYLRTDPRFYATSAEELMMRTSYVLKRMDGQLPNLFGRLPRLPYGIIEIPAYLAPRTTTAYYSPGSPQQFRAGNYAVNTYNLPARPLYEVEALSFHEAVPGHHLQIALAQELELHPFRRSMAFTAYTEGWALYSERLGLEVGFYADPYSNFGRLSYEMWRALRLVVDTGIHWYGWSKEQAVAYMAENSALSMHNIDAEVNRYIFWPGQALAYKLGEIHIRALRTEQEERLGSDFDLRRFHDAILETGNVPLRLVSGEW